MEVQVTGIPTGDNECWVLRVTDAEYRRLLGEDRYREELAERRRCHDEDVAIGIPVGDFSHDNWFLYPDQLLRLAGYEGREEPIALRLSVEKV